MINATPIQHRVLIAVLTFAGLRVSEALGLRWGDVDLDRGHLQVRWQLDHKTRKLVAPKTPSARRAVILMPALGRMLAAHRLQSRFSAATDYVFATAVGTAMNRDNVRSRILALAVERAGLDGQGRAVLRTHDLRHTFASMIIAGGASVVFASSQLGHSSPVVTLNTYAHLFDEREHGARMAEILEDGFADVLGNGARGEQPVDAVLRLPAATK